MPANLLFEFIGLHGPVYLDPSSIVSIESTERSEGSASCRVRCDDHVIDLLNSAETVRQAWLTTKIHALEHEEDAAEKRSLTNRRRRRSELQRARGVLVMLCGLCDELIGEADPKRRRRPDPGVPLTGCADPLENNDPPTA